MMRPSAPLSSFGIGRAEKLFFGALCCGSYFVSAWAAPSYVAEKGNSSHCLPPCA